MIPSGVAVVLLAFVACVCAQGYGVGYNKGYGAAKGYGSAGYGYGKAVSHGVAYSYSSQYVYHGMYHGEYSFVINVTPIVTIKLMRIRNNHY